MGKEVGNFIGNLAEALVFTFSPLPSVIFAAIAMNQEAKWEREMMGSQMQPPVDRKNFVAIAGVDVLRYVGTYAIFTNTGDANLALLWFCGVGAGEWFSKKLVESR